MWHSSFSLDSWYGHPAGAFVLALQQDLVRQMLDVWPCRGQRLLELGCAGGHFLRLFWEQGFDVTGLDQHAALLELARQRLGSRVELRQGVFDHLPFDDGSFDIVVMPRLLDTVPDPAAVLSEALRVAAGGVLFGFLNVWSLPGLLHTLPCPPGQRRRTQARSALKYYRLAHALEPGARLVLRTTLCSPACMWREGRWFRFCSRPPRFLPLGAFGVIRMELNYPPASPVQTLLAKMRFRRPQVASALE